MVAGSVGKSSSPSPPSLAWTWHRKWEAAVSPSTTVRGDKKDAAAAG
jgi:hypothetical protein